MVGQRRGAGLEVDADLLEAHRLGRDRHADRPPAVRRLGQGQHAAGGRDQPAGDQRAQRLGAHLVGRDLAQAHQQVELPVHRLAVRPATAISPTRFAVVAEADGGAAGSRPSST